MGAEPWHAHLRAGGVGVLLFLVVYVLLFGPGVTTCPPTLSRSAPVDRAALKAAFAAHFDVEKQILSPKFALGLADVSLLLPLLVRFVKPGQLAIDIGANVGDTSSEFHAFFTGAACQKWRAGHVLDTGPYSCPPSLKVMSFEPMPVNFALLGTRAEEEGWKKVGWTGVQMALTSAANVPET